jgi:hypothetical protein
LAWQHVLAIPSEERLCQGLPGQKKQEDISKKKKTEKKVQEV